MKLLYRADYGNPHNGFFWGKSASKNYSHYRMGFFCKGLGTYYDDFDMSDSAKAAFRVHLKFTRVVTTAHFTRYKLVPHIGVRYKDKYVYFEGFSMDTNVGTEKSVEEA